MLLKDKVCIITGGGSGMGRAGAKLFAKHGAKVVVADINEVAAKDAADEVNAAGGSAEAFRYDAARSDEARDLVAFTRDTFGRVDSAWANAGLAAPFSTIEDYDEDLFDRLIDVNVKGPWLLAKHAKGELIRTRGTFVITASLSGLQGRPNHSGYQASKGGAVMLTRSLAKEFASTGVRVNSICPVAADTPMLPEFLSAHELMSKEKLTAGIPLGRLATAEDVAKAALFFVSDLSDFVTGINLAVDGGSSC